MVAAILLLLVVVLVSAQSATRSGIIDYSKTTGIQKTDCVILQSAISTVQSASGNAQVELVINYDFNIAKNSINFTGYYCYFSGNQINSNLSHGNVRIKKVNGVVSVENF